MSMLGQCQSCAMQCQQNYGGKDDWDMSGDKDGWNMSGDKEDNMNWGDKDRKRRSPQKDDMSDYGDKGDDSMEWGDKDDMGSGNGMMTSMQQCYRNCMFGGNHDENDRDNMCQAWFGQGIMRYETRYLRTLGFE